MPASCEANASCVVWITARRLPDDACSDDRLFTVYAARRQTGSARLGITVSRRVSNKAVRRNRLKRRVRESFRCHKEPLVGLDLVVIARQEANETDPLQVDQSLFGHWRTSER